MVEPSRNSPAALAAMLRTVARVPEKTTNGSTGIAALTVNGTKDATAATAGEPG